MLLVHPQHQLHELNMPKIMKVNNSIPIHNLLGKQLTFSQKSHLPLHKKLPNMSERAKASSCPSHLPKLKNTPLTLFPKSLQSLKLIGQMRISGHKKERIAHF